MMSNFFFYLNKNVNREKITNFIIESFSYEKKKINKKLVRNYPSYSSFQLFFNLSIVSLIEPTILPSLKMIVFNRLKCNDLASVSWEYCLKHHKFLDLSLTIYSDSILEEICTFCFVFHENQIRTVPDSFVSKKRFLSFFLLLLIKNRSEVDR